MTESVKPGALEKYLIILAENRRVAREKQFAENETRKLEISTWEKTSNIVITYSGGQPYFDGTINKRYSPPRALLLTNGERYKVWFTIDYKADDDPRPTGVVMNSQMVDQDGNGMGSVIGLAEFSARRPFIREKLPDSPFPLLLNGVELSINPDPLSTVPEYQQRLEAIQLIDGIMTDYQRALEADPPAPDQINQVATTAPQIVPPA